MSIGDVSWPRVLSYLSFGVLLVMAYRSVVLWLRERGLVGRRQAAEAETLAAESRNTRTIPALAPVAPLSRRERKGRRVIRLPSGAFSRRQTQQAQMDAAIATLERVAGWQRNVIMGLVIALFMVTAMFGGFYQAHRANQIAIGTILELISEMQAITADTQSAMLTLLGLCESQARSWKDFDGLREEFRRHASDILRATSGR